MASQQETATLPRASLLRWLAGGAICIALLAVAAYSLVEFGSQRPVYGSRPLLLPALPAPAAKPPPPPPAYRVTPESEIITEMKEEARPPPAAPIAVPPATSSPAPLVRPQPPRTPRAIAAAPVRPPPASTPVPQTVRAPAAAPASAPAPAVRPTAQPDLCPGQPGVAQAICLSRRCAEPGARASRQCAQVRETERQIRERMEQGG